MKKVNLCREFFSRSLSVGKAIRILAFSFVVATYPILKRLVNSAQGFAYFSMKTFGEVIDILVYNQYIYGRFIPEGNIIYYRRT